MLSIWSPYGFQLYCSCPSAARLTGDAPLSLAAGFWEDLQCQDPVISASVAGRLQVDDVRVRATGKAVPLPKPGDFPGDPGPLPKPAEETSAYFQVCQTPLQSLSLSVEGGLTVTHHVTYRVRHCSITDKTEITLTCGCRLAVDRRRQHTC